ncbi:MAG: 4-hydroxy-3-methylbut-2-enyl diphosphate reductase [Oribacterium sp.]|jgi:4-hydroxy-3-methylbut-2-enyl diphosphate reductase|nr:4-hydroxy-3-methylbut-2-enyl diphosphate reductase [Oribacterium sp.]MDY6306527.1 4-hydroxy-3-methylbut-2-enyl diphosphate reductase [Oribacterium sp.]MDY6316893.1 4-hydroxy-3-methylbut-2-enyl diphosphate reductase [Oribacterium sp.]
MNVELAKTAGFCFGVERAVSTVYETINREARKSEKERKSIYTYGAIVHNETVVEDLRKKGVHVIETPAELQDIRDGIIIIRAHGVGRDVYTALKNTGSEIIDASCPFVQKIQRLAEENTGDGKKTFIAGNPVHPEIVGIVGWAKGPITVLPDVETASGLPDGHGEKITLLAQTTFNVSKFEQILAILKEKGYYVNAINTICNATFERQTEAAELAKRSDAMIVIGGSSSSNTKKLFEICRQFCPDTQLIQTVKDLEFRKDEAIQNVGITAGASTPKEIIEEVLTYVRNEF